MQRSFRNMMTLTWAAVLLLASGRAHAALIGHWTLDEGAGVTAADSSSFGHDAALTGAPNWTPGVVGSGFDFPGGGANKFSVNLGAELPTGAAERTITAWINPDTAGDRKFLGYGAAGAGTAFNFTYEGGGIRFRHGGGNITYGALPANAWTHVAVRVPAGAALTGDLDVFINGAAAPVTGTGGGGLGVVLNTPASNFNIGDNFQNNSFDGQVDDVQFYSTSLSDTEIATLFNNPGLSLGNIPVTVLSTDFDGRTVAGSTAGNILWTTDGVADPGDLTAAMNPDGLFDTADAQGRFAPDRNLHNEGPWSVDIALDVQKSPIDLTQVSLDALIFNNAGALQGDQRDLDLTLELLDSSETLIDSEMVLDIYANSGTAVQPQAVTFDFTGNTLSNNTSYILRLTALGQGDGNNAGIDNFVVQGVLGPPVPEPATAMLGLLGAAGLMRRRRRC